MGRLLGIDYGSKRVGIAETDDLKIIASPLTTIHSTEVAEFITNYIVKHEVDGIVIGEPKSLNQQDTHATKLVTAFVNYIRKRFPAIPIHMEDERFTSKMAAQSMIMGGVKKAKRQEKGNLDKVSASIILQSYMQRMQ